MNEKFRSKLGIGIVILTISTIANGQVIWPNQDAPAGFECSFESDKCGWIVTADSNVNWVRKNGRTYWGPSIDHTKGDKTGYYAYFEEIDSWDWYDFDYAFDESAKLISPVINGSQEQCMKFWYYMSGDSVGELSIFFKINTGASGLEMTTEPVWKKVNDHGDHWNLGFVSYKGGNDSLTNFIIEAHTGKGQYHYGDIAIDDITFRLGNCEDASYISATCDFEEEHICGYTSDSTADFNWTRNKGKTISGSTGPSVDVTTGTSAGYYMFIETSTPQKRGQKARLVSPVESVSGFNNAKCLFFYYHAFGNDVAELNLYSIHDTDYSNGQTNSMNKLWSVNMNLGDQWFLASVNTDFGYDYRVVFEGVVGKSYQGDVAIDDVFMSARTCPMPANCDFEDGDFDLCSWTNVDISSGGFDWQLYNSQLASQMNGPIVMDNTLGDSNGRFMVATSKAKGAVAKVFSEKLEPTSFYGGCMTFYYYFSGSSNYNLTIRLSNLNGTSGPALWNLDDKQIPENKAQWQYAQFKFYSADPYRVFIEATSGTNAKHFIGVDDINFLSGNAACNGAPSIAIQSNNLPTTQAPTTLTPPATIEEYDCDFERPCRWRFDPMNTEYKWEVTQASSNGLLKPNSDHTYQENGKGNYIGIVSTNNTAKAKALYISPYINGTTSTYKCLEFWYYMYGAEVGTLFVQRKMNASYNSPPYTVWQRSSSSRPDWQLGQVRVGYGSNRIVYDVRIGFEMTASLYNGYAAIDDISIHDGNCIPVGFW